MKVPILLTCVFQGAVVAGLHTMVTYEPLHDYMVNVGVVRLLCE